MWQNSKNFLREGNIPSSGKPLNRKVNISQTRPQTGSPWQTKLQIPPKSNFVVLLGVVTGIMVGVTYKIKNGPKMVASPKGHSVMGDSLQSWKLVAERIACRRKTGWRILFFSTRLWCKSLPCILLMAVVSQQLVWSQNPLWGLAPLSLLAVCRTSPLHLCTFLLTKGLTELTTLPALEGRSLVDMVSFRYIISTTRH